ncbi:site-specific DNA-methyltransferase [Fusobacterium necrophorum]|uniref:site-specific DNA-methyltransferase n=1 Tax=Fusobacterium necrophorum TaxID=859 RepID=UPI003F9ED720
MDKMRMESVDMTAQNIEKIGLLFPNCITETKDDAGKSKKIINFELLRLMLSDNIIDGDESYGFTWVGKKASVIEANRPIRKTLRPALEESVNWENTENLFIEGDNLEVLKLLQESYLGRVKMIYIDPPYNTGHDFIYPDSFMMDSDEYDAGSGYFDENGNVNFDRTNENGRPRYHSDWCSLMYPRLLLSRNLLSDTGVIFISIDENEVHNMRKICDEVFGEANFISQLGWQKVYSPKNQARYFSNDYEFVLCYCKNINEFKLGELPRTPEMNARYKNPDNDPRGDWKPGDCVGNGVRKNGYYDVTGPTGKVFNVPEGKHWVYAPDTMKRLIEENRIWWGKDGSSFPAVKQFLSDVGGRKASSLLLYEDYGHTDMAKKDLIKLFPDLVKVPFDTPKPIKLIKMLAMLGSDEDDIILDFFAGSATTAHSLFELNAEKNSNRKFILVQLPEPLLNNEEANKNGMLTISDVAKERIRRAGKKVKEENPLLTQSLDTGFRVLKLDESNMTDVYYSPAEYSQDLLSMLESNVKPDRNDLDLLFGCLLEWGLPLSLPYSSEQIDGCTVHNYNDGDLIACFDENVPDSVIKEIAKRQPLRAVFRDNSFADSPSKINVGEVFKLLAPDTRVKVI